MPTTQTTLFPPPSRGMEDLSPSLRNYLFTLQYLLPLRLVNTSTGPYTEALPAAGVDFTTGQSSQNQELTFLKTSADANVFTITGAQGGPHLLNVQYDFRKFKSDGTNWWCDTNSDGGVF